ncbi:MAG TPA: thioredoxin family protein [Pyrinomonadaceae bacterium]
MSPKIIHVVLALAAVGALAAVAPQPAAAQSSYTPVKKYDPKRDAARDIDDAVAEAKRTNRRILLVVGGEWCSWCHILENYFAAQPDLKARRDKAFVTVKINFSDENPNEAVLSRYPPSEGYPHIFVLDSDGKFLHSQGTAVLESGKSYNLEKMNNFLTQWAPPVKPATAP